MRHAFYRSEHSSDLMSSLPERGSTTAFIGENVGMKRRSEQCCLIVKWSTAHVTSRRFKGSSLIEKIRWFTHIKLSQFLTNSGSLFKWPPPSSVCLCYRVPGLFTHTHTHTIGYGFLSVARGDAHVEQEQQASPNIFGRDFPRQHDDLYHKSGWENVNETKDRRTSALIWWRRNKGPAKLSQDHVRAHTWGTDKVEAIVLIWMQIWKDGRESRKGDPLILSSVAARGMAGSVAGVGVCGWGHRLRRCMKILHH